MKKVGFILFAFMAIILGACSKSENIEEEPQTLLSDIAGVWSEYAYLCSDGYFVDISDSGYNMYYEFAHPNIFTQYSIDENGNKNIEKQGEWTYNSDTRIAHVKDSRGWDLDILFTFIEPELESYHAIMEIHGRTNVSSSTIKVKLMQ